MTLPNRIRAAFLICSLFVSISAFRMGSFTDLAFSKSSLKRSLLYSTAFDTNETEESLGDQPEGFQSGFISIIGNPNVGKSTLMNKILGETLCITSPKPQTTRHRILGLVNNDQYQLIFSDTPGMLEPKYKLQESMQESIRGAAGDADVLLLVTDVYGEGLFDKKIMERLTLTTVPIIILINKMDLVDGIKHPKTTEDNESTLLEAQSHYLQYFHKPQDKNKKLTLKERIKLRNSRLPEEGTETETETEESDTENEAEKGKGKPTVKDWPTLVRLWQKRLPKAEILGVSALKGLGVSRVLRHVLNHVPEGPRYFPADTLTNRDERFFTTEIIRETLLEMYQEEIPYSCEVVIDLFRDKNPNLSVIEAGIIVNRESQKIIVIGKQGQKVKELGVSAREKLEKFLGRKVHLSLHVRVDPDWRSNDDSLSKYGYIDSDFG